ncbi:MAG: DUF1501 domain-containing protein [Planctomycetota bacterium]
MSATTFTRRDALLGGSRLLAAGAGLSMFRDLHAMQLSSTAAASPAAPYKALVCVYLSGGNDSFNLLVPTSAADHGAYMASRGNLGITADQLLPINPINPQGRAFGLHPSVPELRDMFEAGSLAFVVNAGTLMAPISKAAYRANSAAKPAQLFSHSDQTQQWESQSAAADTPHGWAGRASDLLVSLNNGSPLSPAISLAGSTRLLRGQTVAPYALGTGGSVQLSGFSGTRGQRRLATFQQLLQKRNVHMMETEFADLQAQAMELDTLIRGALGTAPPLQTAFPTTSIGRQLKMVAQMIGLRDTLGVARQVFYVRLGGFDTHADQLAFHAQLLSQLAIALKAFADAMAELGTSSAVTTFTASEFGRTLSSNGSGSDHGWGGNQMVIGGAVRGRDLYGTWPSLILDSDDDVGRGRLIPTTAVEQVCATLASWFGVNPSDLPTLFPRLSEFASSDLGFMS